MIGVLRNSLLVVAVATSPYILLGVSLPLPGWQFDAPIADLAALGCLLLAPLAGRRAPAPAPVAWAALVLVGLAAALLGDAPREAVHVLIRKPIFLYLAWGVGVATAVALAPRGVLTAALGVACAGALAVTVGASFVRIARGDALWFAAIDHLTNNHKTIALASVPLLGLYASFRHRWGWTSIVAAVALAASMSRTAWIAAGAGLAQVLRWRGRPLAAIPGLVPGLILGGAAAAVLAPTLARSVAQLDAARSRLLLDRRALELWWAHPLLGASPGANTRFEASIFPDYRVNGVDAHGVIQKLASEYGLLGLLAFAAATATIALRVRARAHPGAWAAFVAAHVSLLFSTEVYSQTHWVVIAVCWGLAARR